MPLSRKFRVLVVASALWVSGCAAYGYFNLPNLAYEESEQIDSCMAPMDAGNSYRVHKQAITELMARKAFPSEVAAYLTSWGFGDQLKPFKAQAYQEDPEGLLMSVRGNLLDACNGVAAENRARKEWEFRAELAKNGAIGLVIGWLSIFLASLALKWILRGKV